MVTTKFEHPSVDFALKRAGAVCTRLKADRTGRVLFSEVPDAEAVFVHHVQSELGCIQDVDRLFACYPGAVKITDTIQSAAKLPLPVSADILTVSGSKFGIPGIAALLVRKEFAGEIETLVKKEREEYLSARISIPHFLAMTKVASKMAENMEQNLAHARLLQRVCRECAANANLECTIPQENSSPWICHISLKDADGAVVVRLLGNEGICAGAGTACSAETGNPSAALLALGRSRKAAFGGLRISFAPSTTEDNVKKLFEVLEKTLKNY